MSRLVANQKDWLREFIRTSADDITYLRQARDALLTHPRVHTDGVEADAAMCRAVIVTSVTAVERIIKAWRDVAFLEKYNDKNVSNEVKIQRLQDCFESAGVETNRDILDDYLAIKYLRNTVEHLEWIETQQQHIQRRDFPTDLRRLDHRHWIRIINTVWQLLGYFSKAALRTRIPLDDDRLQEMTDLQIAAVSPQQSHLVSLLLSSFELPKAWWTNLENLSDWISRDLVVAADEVSEVFRVAVDSWRRYVAATSFGDELRPGVIQKSVETIERLHAERIYPRVPIGVNLEALAQSPGEARKISETVGLSLPEIETIERALVSIRKIAESGGANRPLTIWSPEVPRETAAELLRLFVFVPPGLSGEEVIDALQLGWRVYKSFVNRVPVDLFLSQLPCLAEERRAECLEAGRAALAMFKLRTSWYAWVESDERSPQQPPYELWSHFYRLVEQLEA